MGCFRFENKLIWGVFSSQDDEIYKLLAYYNRVGTSLFIIFGPYKSEGLILSLFIRYNGILKSNVSVEF